MSHIVPLLIIAFVVWRWLVRRGRPEADVQSDGNRATSPWSRLVDDASDDDAVDLGDAVATLFGERSGELLGKVVDRVLQDSKLGTELSQGIAELVAQAESIEPATRVTTPQAQARRIQRVKYLLDGDGGHRQKSDRIVSLQQSMRGKGLCSPR